jgi:3-oxoacyl-[acyl-carrier protein] reductase
LSQRSHQATLGDVTGDAAKSFTNRKVAIVTGGSRGIVAGLARQGLDVTFTYRESAAAAEALVGELAVEGGAVRACCVDARDARACTDLVEKVIGAHGRIDVLVNNAAAVADKLLAVMTLAEWDAVLDTSLQGLFGTTQPTAKQMMRQRSGRIVTVSSASAFRGVAGQTSYATAKAGIVGFTRSLAKELAPLGIAVNAVAPGFVATEMLARYPADQLEQARASVPMRRFATPDEIAALVGYLALSAPPYLTGQTLVIDGGLTA